MKVDLFLALFFPLLLGMLIWVDKRVGFRHAIDDEEYKILKQLEFGKFVEPVKEQARKEKNPVIKFWRSKGKYSLSDDDNFAYLHDEKQICTDFIADGDTALFLHGLLQNATNIITNCDSNFITKWDRSLLQNALGFLLQNATVIIKSNVYYKLRQYMHYY